MTDKMEREIEEILAKLDGEKPRAGQADKTPVSILSRRKRAPNPVVRASRGGGSVLDRVNPTTLLFAGAGIMVAGLILSNFYSPLIWASFAGVVVFLAAFLWSFRRTPRASGGAASAPRGHFWRDRYIEYTPAAPSLTDRVRRRFRR
jgi:hypothetical protein